MPAVVGVDLSSRAVDIVRLDENNNEATWHSIPLAGSNAWDRTRAIPACMPTGGFWQDIYLCAIEKPFGPSRLAQSVLMRAQGAILASVPHTIPVWEVTPAEWKRHLGIPLAAKPAWNDFPASLYGIGWDQNARDALGVALYARDTNAEAVSRALKSAS